MNSPDKPSHSIIQISKSVLKQIFGAGNPAGATSYLILAVGALLVMVCYFWFDRMWLDYAGSWWRNTPVRGNICGWMGIYGDFIPFNLTIFAVLFAGGRMRKSGFLLRLAVVSLISGALAGGVVHLAKCLLGRPRPTTVLHHQSANPNEFRGPFHGAAWESFPSGHTASSMGAAVPLVLAAPEIGVPVVCLSACIAGSRLAGLNHYPSDIIAGAALGLFFGLRGGWSLHTLRGRLRQRARGGDSKVILNGKMESVRLSAETTDYSDFA